MKFSSVLHHLNRIILVLEVFYDLHYCIIGREVQEVITFSVVPNFLVKKPLILSGFEAVVVLYTVF